jgi:hypothetical protein
MGNVINMIGGGKPEEEKTVYWEGEPLVITPSPGKTMKRVTVKKPVLISIAITTNPTKMSYEIGDSFDPAGMVVKATYDHGAVKQVYGYTYSPKTFTSEGNQIVTISYTENGVTKTATVTVGVPVKIVPFASGTWGQIHDMVQAAISGKLILSNYWAVGDIKDVTLTTGEIIQLQIAGFNHDTYSDGVTAPITLVMKNCLNTISKMNSSSINTGGYPASAMKTYVETNIYNKLPSDLKAIVAPVKKKCYTTYNQAGSLSEASYNVWLLAEAEVLDSVSYTIGNGEGTKYPIFTDNASRIKKVNGSADGWWLRSAYSGNSTRFVFVFSDGSASHSFAVAGAGVAVGLCIR